MTADVGAPVAGVDRVVTTYDAREVTRLVEVAADRDIPVLTSRMSENSDTSPGRTSMKSTRSPGARW